ncbi:winged helix-turn-helix transcriptional regulator [Pseudorhodoplanes sp.]|uniref:winged helix-turn-helix transcriptional regulator n=1 Tax=Pseudorhodoplanes sp. TaxID=1934341 RepID=UPI003D0CD9BB
MSGTRYAQFCALARAAEILGERWTLLIIRELLLGQKRFSDLSDRLSGVSPTVLTTRLNTLIESGVVRRVDLPPPFNAQVYELTPIGQSLKPAIRELIRWGGHFIFPMRPDDEFDPDWGLLALDASARRTPTPAHKIVLRIKHKAAVASFLIEGGKAGTTITKSDGPGSSIIETTFDVFLPIISLKLPLERAMAEKRATVEGSLRIARMLPRFFDRSERHR